jgi:hypothetical protein
LANIAAKYKLLNKPAIRIDDGATEFIVSLPIIKIKIMRVLIVEDENLAARGSVKWWKSMNRFYREK